MSTVDVQNQIIGMQSATNQYSATQPKTTGSSAMNGDMFLKLMMEQLKYQDPMEPIDNKEFLAQQAQFTQVSATQELNKNLSKNNFIMQTLALVGKEVTLTDPENYQNTITGKVTEAAFDSETSSIKINGKSYPLSLVQSVREASSSTTN